MRARTILFPLLVSLLSVAVPLFLAEAVVRILDGYSLTSLTLVGTLPPAPAEDRTLSGMLENYVQRLPVAEGVDRDWFAEPPPPLPNRGSVPEEFREIQGRIGDADDRALLADVFKLWNENLIRERVCKRYDGFTRRLQKAAGFAFVYPGPENSSHPLYRYYPGVTTPLGLVTNRFGWRGPEIDLVKPSRTIRIAFLGASTTVSAHDFPFSYPEYVGHWLDLWARSRKLDLRFEILNTGREGIRSTDIAAIVRHELLTARPDLAVYYEGSNQFFVNDMLTVTEKASPPAELDLEDAPKGLSIYSALARRFDNALDRFEPGAGEEPSKPVYRLRWPHGLDRNDPDLTSEDLPLDLPVILRDLDRIRALLTEVGAELAVSSFVWMVEDGMVLDPLADRHLLDYLNRPPLWPSRYRDLRLLADFQNLVLARYAAGNDLPFLDVAARLPRDPALFTDAIHMRPEGLRLRAWITLQLLIPLLEERIASGALPRRDDRPAGRSANIEIFRSDLRCAGDGMTARAVSREPGGP